MTDREALEKELIAKGWAVPQSAMSQEEKDFRAWLRHCSFLFDKHTPDEIAYIAIRCAEFSEVIVCRVLSSFSSARGHTTPEAHAAFESKRFEMAVKQRAEWHAQEEKKEKENQRRFTLELWKDLHQTYEREAA